MQPYTLRHADNKRLINGTSYTDATQINWVTPNLGITNFNGAWNIHSGMQKRHWSLKRQNTIQLINVAPELAGRVHWPSVLVDPDGDLTKPLDEAVQMIKAFHDQGKRVIIHCAWGMERAPLTVAYFLSGSVKRSIDTLPDIKAAYEQIRKVRPFVLDRTTWWPTPYQPTVWRSESKDDEWPDATDDAAAKYRARVLASHGDAQEAQDWYEQWLRTGEWDEIPNVG